MITFTGSPPVGWSIRERAPRKKVSLELGNNSPVIIEADADWKAAAAKIAVGGYSFAGQSCISVQRVYVQSSIAEQFTEALVAEVESLVVGDPGDGNTDVSALINHGETERVKSWVDEAVEQGAELRTGGDLDPQGVLRPTVLTNVQPDMEVCRNEVFGPVVGIQAYEGFDEALRLANDTPLRLAGRRVHRRPGQGVAGRAHARLRRCDRQRGADVARRPDALRRRPRQRQHPRRPALHRAAR